MLNRRQALTGALAAAGAAVAVPMVTLAKRSHVREFDTAAPFDATAWLAEAERLGYAIDYDPDRPNRGIVVAHPRDCSGEDARRLWQCLYGDSPTAKNRNFASLRSRLSDLGREVRVTWTNLDRLVRS